MNVIATIPGTSVRVERVEVPGKNPHGDDHPTNSYLVGDDEQCLIVDAPFDARPLVEAVAGRSIVAIGVTHGHWDHLLAIPVLREATGAPALLHADDRFLWDTTISAQAPDGGLTDGQRIAVAGHQVEVMHTPGHTPGSSSFYLAEAGVVLSGDAMFPGGPGATRWDYSDFSLAIASIRDRFMSLADDDVVAPGHGDSTTIGAERGQVDEWEARGY